MYHPIAIAMSKQWIPGLCQDIEQEINSAVWLIKNPEQLCQAELDKRHIKRIFFPHWSYIVKPSIFQNYECVMFHMTDLPFGRGGSPLQNLIQSGFQDTMISAFLCEKELDSGPIIIKYNLSLHGTAEEIYIRSTKIIKKMMVDITLAPSLQATPQSGEATFFQRRKPEQSKINNITDLNSIYDHIRMLDAENYPKAYIDIGEFRIEFTRASLKKQHILADVKITKKICKATL